MVRAGVVTHPRDWPTSGYHEIQGIRQRYRIVDRQALAGALEIDVTQLADAHRPWIEEALRKSRLEREPHWSNRIAVGSRACVDRVAEDLRGRARYRSIASIDDTLVIRETAGPYDAI